VNILPDFQWKEVVPDAADLASSRSDPRRRFAAVGLAWPDARLTVIEDEIERAALRCGAAHLAAYRAGQQVTSENAHGRSVTEHE